MNSTYSLILPWLLLITFIALGVVYIWYRLWRRRYTRERFSFYSLRILVGFFLTNAGLILAFNPLHEFVAPVVNKILGTNIPVVQLEEAIIGSILTIVCGWIISSTIRQLHANWDGLKSTRQVELKETLQTISWLEDAKYFRKHKSEIEIYGGVEKTKPEVFYPEEPDVRPWYIKAKTLLNLYDRQYDIQEDDWYGEYNCYIGRYGQEGEKIGVLCLLKPPNETYLHHFLNFINSREGKFHKLIVAIDGIGKRRQMELESYQFEIRFQSELLDSLVSLSEYRKYINDYFHRNQLENSSQHLADIYVPLEGHMVKIDQGKLKKDLSIPSVEEHILSWVKDEQSNKKEHLVILGDYGQGKTVLMHKVVQAILNSEDSYNRIPILIELRGMSPRNADELDILGQWAKRFNAPQQALEELHRAGKLLLILDGFDEMDLVGDTELLFNHFSQLWALAKVPKSKIIIAGRPNLFADDEERRMALGIQEARNYLPYSRAIFLSKLQPKQIEKVLRDVQPSTKEGILNALRTADPNGNFVELVTRPSTLYQLSTVWDSELAHYKDQLNSAIVIQSFINKTYQRQASKASTFLTSFERDYFMIGIAVGMMLDNGYTNQIKHKDLRALIQVLWDNYPPKLPPYADAMEGHAATEPLPERLRENAYPLETIIKDVRVGGILVQDLSGRDLFKFAHKSYLECLVSTFFTGFILPKEIDRFQLMKVNAIVKATNFNLSKMQLSSDVERFNAELFLGISNIINPWQSSYNIHTGERLEVMTLDPSNAFKVSEDLFQKLIVNPFPFFGRYFPKITAWCTLHVDQKWFLLIFLLSILSLLLGGVFWILGLQKDLLLTGIGYFNLILYLVWILLVLSYRWKFNSLNQIALTRFSLYTKLYLRSCALFSIAPTKFSNAYQLVLLKDWEKNEALEIIIIILSNFIFFAGALSGVSMSIFILPSPLDKVLIVIGLIPMITFAFRQEINAKIPLALTFVIFIVTLFIGPFLGTFSNSIAVLATGFFLFYMRKRFIEKLKK